MAQKGRTVTGARARLMINGKKIGYATSVQGSESIDYMPLELLDNVEVEEFVPTGYHVTLSASRVVISGETLKSEGYFPATGVNSDEHLLNILLSAELTAVIEDTKPDASGSPRILYTFEGVKVTGHNFNFQARSIVSEDVTFVARRLKDTSEV